MPYSDEELATLYSDVLFAKQKKKTDADTANAAAFEALKNKPDPNTVSISMGIPASVTGDANADMAKKDRQYPLSSIPEAGYIRQTINNWMQPILKTEDSVGAMGPIQTTKNNILNDPNTIVNQIPLTGYVWGGDDAKFNVRGAVSTLTPNLVGLQTSSAIGAINNDPIALGTLGHELTHVNQLTNMPELERPPVSADWGTYLDSIHARNAKMQKYVDAFPDALDAALGPQSDGSQTAYTKKSSVAEQQGALNGYLIEMLMNAKTQEDLLLKHNPTAKPR